MRLVAAASQSMRYRCQSPRSLGYELICFCCAIINYLILKDWAVESLMEHDAEARDSSGAATTAPPMSDRRATVLFLQILITGK